METNSSPEQNLPTLEELQKAKRLHEQAIEVIVLLLQKVNRLEATNKLLRLQISSSTRS